ncbi:MAG: hypothetical protein HQL97_07875 [Magnetococcales bacterium]|nr:hypothetical protein [Magnetococcales bacterium]
MTDKNLNHAVTHAMLVHELAPIRTDLALIKGLLGIQMAGVLALILKSFFPH